MSNLPTQVMGDQSARSLLRFGTRGSRLALWQTRHVIAAVRMAGYIGPIEEVVVKTLGDQVTGVPLFRVGGQGLFVKELEEALRDGRADVAVHSLKDLPHQLAEGLLLGAIGPREDPRDALLTRTGGGLTSLPRGARVGTSSLRRRAQLARLRSDLEFVDLRGNLDTRLRKLDAGEMDACVLAAAGLRRLGLSERISEYLPIESMVPAAGQGMLGIEIRSADRARMADWLATLDDPMSRAMAEAERACLGSLQGGCQVPLAVHAVPVGDPPISLPAADAAAGAPVATPLSGNQLRVLAFLGEPDGCAYWTAERIGPASAAAELGRSVAEALLDQGAAALLSRLRVAGAIGSPIR